MVNMPQGSTNLPVVPLNLPAPAIKDNGGEIHRPLAADYEIPHRGAEGHGVDNDVKSVDFSPNPFDTTPVDSGGNKFVEIPKPEPIGVSVYPTIDKRVIRETRIRQAAFVSNPGGTTHGLPWLPLVVQVLGTDNTRVSATFFPPAAGMNWALSTDQSFFDWILVSAVIPLTLFGQNTIYAAPCFADDVTGGQLVIKSEHEYMVDALPQKYVTDSK